MRLTYRAKHVVGTDSNTTAADQEEILLYWSFFNTTLAALLAHDVIRAELRCPLGRFAGRSGAASSGRQQATARAWLGSGLAYRPAWQAPLRASFCSETLRL